MSADLLVDGGQSSCRVALVDRGIRLASWCLPGLAYGSDGEGVETVVGLLKAIDRGTRGRRGAARAVWLGLSGMPADEASRSEVCRAAMSILGVAGSVATSDLVPAYVGALGLRPGAVVTAGSGAVALAIGAEGALAEVGDHGALLGDEGSAYWIGRAGIRAAVRSRDGWGSATALEGAAAERYGALGELQQAFRRAENPVDELARFAVDVARAADDGDAVATRIVVRAGELLAAMLDAAARKVERGGEAGFALSWSGRLLSSGAVLWQAFEAGLRSRRGAAACLQRPAGSALDGLQAMAAAPSLSLVATNLHMEGIL